VLVGAVPFYAIQYIQHIHVCIYTYMDMHAMRGVGGFAFWFLVFVSKQALNFLTDRFCFH
jgi:hypothetical protein